MSLFSNKIMASADIHLSKSYYPYIKDPLQFFVDKVKEERPLITALTGDIFDDRINADEDIYHYAIQTIIKISQYTKYLIIVDGTFSHDYNTLDILYSFKGLIPNIYFVKHKEVLNLDNLKILILPEEYPQNPEEYYKEVLSGTYHYILGHGDIEGGVYHSGVNNSMLKGFRFKISTLSEIAKYTIFGHLHKHQLLGKKQNVLYTGSLARFKFGEEEEKGFVIIDDIYSDTPKLEFIPTPSTKLNTIELTEDLELSDISELENIDKIKFKIPKIEGLNKELIDKLKELNLYDDNVIIERIKSKDDEEYEDLEYKDIENLELTEKYKFMYNKDVEYKKISLKDQKFFTEDLLISTLESITDTVKKNKREED